MNEGTKAGALTLGTKAEALTFKLDILTFKSPAAAADCWLSGSGSSHRSGGGGGADMTRGGFSWKPNRNRN